MSLPISTVPELLRAMKAGGDLVRKAPDPNVKASASAVFVLTLDGTERRVSGPVASRLVSEGRFGHGIPLEDGSTLFKQTTRS